MPSPCSFSGRSTVSGVTHIFCFVCSTDHSPLVCIRSARFAHAELQDYRRTPEVAVPEILVCYVRVSLEWKKQRNGKNKRYARETRGDRVKLGWKRRNAWKRFAHAYPKLGRGSVGVSSWSSPKTCFIKQTHRIKPAQNESGRNAVYLCASCCAFGRPLAVISVPGLRGLREVYP